MARPPDILLFAALEHFEMRRTFVEARENGPRRCRHVADGIVLAHEFSNRVEAFEPHQCDELDFGSDVAAQQIDVTENLESCAPRCPE